MITYDNGQRPRERADVACTIQVHDAVCAESIDDELRHVARSTFSATHVLETEHHFNDLR